MTPKEKAKELVDKYKFYLGNEKENINEAKDLALICVEEIRDLMNRLQNYEQAVYWKKVKEEIEKL